MIQVVAKAYDNPIPGYKTKTVGNLRLWEAVPENEFDLTMFNEGKYTEVETSQNLECAVPTTQRTIAIASGLPSNTKDMIERSPKKHTRHCTPQGALFAPYCHAQPASSIEYVTAQSPQGALFAPYCHAQPASSM